MKYKAVIFDLFGTLVEKFPVDESLAVLEDIAVVLGVDFKEFTRAWWDSFDERHSGRYGSLEDDFRCVANKLGVFPSPAQTEQSAQIDIEYVGSHIIPRQGAVELLDYLKGEGYKLGMVSNWSDEIPRIWAGVSISGCFDVTIFSCQAKIMKPDPRIYTMALEQLSVKASETLFIGDGDSGEIFGASDVGMDAVLISTHEDSGWPGHTITSLDEVKELLI